MGTRRRRRPLTPFWQAVLVLRSLRDGPRMVTTGWSTCVNTVRVAVEHAIATLEVRWAALRPVTSDPTEIGPVTAAALVLTRHEDTR